MKRENIKKMYNSNSFKIISFTSKLYSIITIINDEDETNIIEKNFITQFLKNKKIKKY